MTGVEFSDPDHGVAAAMRSGATVLFDHEEVVAAEPDGNSAEGQMLDPDAPFPVGLRLGGAELDLELTKLGTPIKLSGETVPSEELVACRVIGTLRRDGSETEVASLGVRSQAAEADWSQIERRRSLAVALADGGLFALSAALPAGAGGHDEEEVVAAMTGHEGEPVAISEALLSTTYDDAGRHIRASIEVWLEGESIAPLRAGGAIVCGASVPLGELRLDTAFFRWSVDGRPGLGRYEVLRRA
jgi:hypothetical protein